MQDTPAYQHGTVTAPFWNLWRQTSSEQPERQAKVLLQSTGKTTSPTECRRNSADAASREKTWTPGVCTGQSGPRSYKVKVGDQEYRRNRRQLIQTNESPPLPHIPATPTGPRSFETTPETTQGDTLETTPTQIEENPKVPTSPVEPRRSSRIRKKPDWFSKHADDGWTELSILDSLNWKLCCVSVKGKM